MANTNVAAHVLCKQYPELTSDAVSHYVHHLKDILGPAKASAVYSMACRSAPIGENPLGLRRGSVVEIAGERYLVLGSGFMTLELASLSRKTEVRTIGKDELIGLEAQGFRVLDDEESTEVLEQLVTQ